MTDQSAPLQAPDGPRVIRTQAGQVVHEIIVFFVKQVWACLFGIALLALLVLTYLFYPDEAALSRYDFLVICAVAIQVIMLVTKLETWEEARVILIFHIVGTAMEIFKTHVGSWAYPETNLLRIGGVPLFTGFMYAAIGSYIARCWRLYDAKFTRFPPLWAQGLLGLAVYVNFFAHHYTIDIRMLLFAISALLYGPCIIHLKIDREWRPFPLIAILIGIAGLIWIAENIGTLTQTWMYPGGDGTWSMVPLTKMGAWYLLMLISFVLVSGVNNKSWR